MRRREFIGLTLRVSLLSYMFDVKAQETVASIIDDLFPYLHEINHSLCILDSGYVSVTQIDRRNVYAKHIKERKKQKFIICQGYVLTETQLWLLKNYDK